MSVKLVPEFKKKIAEGLNWKLAQVEDAFDVEEDKQGFFVVTLKPKKFLDAADFKAVCSLTRDLGGDGGYVKASRCWKVPGPLAKKPVASQMPTSVPTSVPTSLPTMKSGFEFLPIAALVSMPFQSRADLPDPDLEDLAESIKEHGVVEPIVVREKDGFYQIVLGERRVKASRMARQGDIPAIVKVLSDEEAYALQLIENIQRKDLSDIEKAHALDRYLKTFGCTQDVLAKKLGKKQNWVSRHLSMLQLEEANIIPRGIMESGVVTEYQAREILAADPEQKGKIIDKINETGKVPSVTEMEKMKQKTVLCADCGLPVESPVHLDGKFYHDDCAEDLKAKSTQGLLPETKVKFEPNTPNEPEAEPEKKAKQPEPEDVAEVTCSVCSTVFRVRHFGPHDHRIQYFKEA